MPEHLDEVLRDHDRGSQQPIDMGKVQSIGVVGMRNVGPCLTRQLLSAFKGKNIYIASRGGIDRDRLDDIIQMGAIPVDKITDLVPRCDMIVTAIKPTHEAIMETYTNIIEKWTQTTQERAIAAAAAAAAEADGCVSDCATNKTSIDNKQALVLIDLSSSAPKTSGEINSLIKGKPDASILYHVCPFWGPPAFLGTGKNILAVSGPARHLISDFLVPTVFGNSIDVGLDVTNGSAIKLLGNHVFGSVNQVVGEMMVLADTLGIDRESVYSFVFKERFPAMPFLIAVERMVVDNGRGYENRIAFPTASAVPMLQCLLDMASTKETAVPTEYYEINLHGMKEAAKKGPSWDISSVISVISDAVGEISPVPSPITDLGREGILKAMAHNVRVTINVAIIQTCLLADKRGIGGEKIHQYITYMLNTNTIVRDSEKIHGIKIPKRGSSSHLDIFEAKATTEDIESLLELATLNKVPAPMSQANMKMLTSALKTMTTDPTCDCSILLKRLIYGEQGQNVPPMAQQLNRTRTAALKGF
ncbi:hypothetical protein H4219_000108 [Mycoemilia scoparia]|uniref:Uncharacterized protein n=1 Tax=Mycoemilia scoparia TaxID=417184 RepID=A0A9W8A6R5_9FUNG|nr:hypothetical protein H4219_000108 [Mycoemilia scoparia]